MLNGNLLFYFFFFFYFIVEDRMKRTSLAIAPFPEFVLQPYEALRAEVSCSYQTMEHFSKIYTDDEFYFIIGADSLMAIETLLHP